MLPDFVALKKDLTKRLTGHATQQMHSSSLVGLASRIRIHEGDNGWVIHYPDGSSEESTYEKAQGEFQVDISELQESGLAAIHEAFAEVQKEIQATMERGMISEVMEATESAGTVTHAGGSPFTAELYLESLEKLQFSFNPDGTWRKPQLVIHPKQVDRVATELKRLETEPELQRRLTELVTEKREEWHERESYRELVD